MAAARRRKGRRRRKGARRLPAWIPLAVLLAGLLALGSWWARTDDGQLWLARHGLPSARQWATARVHAALLAELQAQALGDSSQVVGGPRPGVTTVKVESARPLLELNIAFTAAATAAGGELLRGSRHEAEGGETLELHFGLRRELSHRVVVMRGRRAPAPPPLPVARVAVLVDDFGHSLARLPRAFLELEHPITVAILPGLRSSRRVLTEARRAGKQAFLHLPMEPGEGNGPGPGDEAVLAGMDPGEVEALVERCLDELPGVQGVNNHMGSRATRGRPEMDAVMRVLARRGLVFVDSWTTSRSVAHEAARELGVPSLKNDLFLDADTEDPDVVERRLHHLLDKARERGWALGITHPNAHSLEALRRVLPTLDPADVVLVPVAELVHELGARRP